MQVVLDLKKMARNFSAGFSGPNYVSVARISSAENDIPNASAYTISGPKFQIFLERTIIIQNKSVSQ